jgi:hypothetical protein
VVRPVVAGAAPLRADAVVGAAVMLANVASMLAAVAMMILCYAVVLAADMVGRVIRTVTGQRDGRHRQRCDGRDRHDRPGETREHAMVLPVWAGLIASAMVLGGRS